MTSPEIQFDWDGFVSHASEDKVSFVEPLVVELQKYGLRIWYDQFTLRIGSSLRESIDVGLASSRYGIVVLSPAFFSKNWPIKELNGLFARQIQEGQMLLPIRHGMSQEELLKHSPMMADIKAASSEKGPAAVAKELVTVIRPEALKFQQGVADITKMASRLGETIEGEGRGLRADIILSSDIKCGLGIMEEPPVVPGMVASIIQDGAKVNLIATDPAKYNSAPLTGTVSLTGEALAMIEEATKTGETLRLGPEHVADASMEILSKLFPDTKFSTLVVAPSPELTRRVHQYGVIFEAASGSVTYPLIHFRVTKPGTEQITFVSQDHLPIVMTFILGLAKGRNTTFNYQLLPGTYRVDDYEKAQLAVKLCREPGAVIRLVDPSSQRSVIVLNIPKSQG